MKMKGVSSFLLILLSFLISGLNLYAQSHISAYPKWVNQIEVENGEIYKESTSNQYLLVDFQENLQAQTKYIHFAIKILNSEGVQSFSDISETYDPSYQELNFHKLRVIRGGENIDKLHQTEIKTIQRETSLERALYDGSYTALIHLSDIREGDILEYAYSIKGFNPINKGNFSITFYQQYNSPVNRIYNRIVLPADYKAGLRYYNDAERPGINRDKNSKEYVWDLDGSDYKLSDSNVPSWYDDYKRVSLSTFESWESVVNWALPLYNYDPKTVESIVTPLIVKDNEEETIINCINLVQNEVRYLGMESGINAYKPHNPLQVYKQRYGDCKDKSLLLVSLLRSAGVESYPLLVNTSYRHTVDSKPPSNSAFDHCVVLLNYGGIEYVVDPTISNQGGDLDSRSTPHYGKGLLVAEGQTELYELEDRWNAFLHVNETIDFDSIGGPATLEVQSIYKGGKADGIRNYFLTSSKDEIQKSYLNYYSNLYPSIESNGEIVISDNNQRTSNELTITEKYLIPEYWLPDEEMGLYAEIYPIILESEINYPQSATRKMPYSIGDNLKFIQTTQVNFPEPWNVETSVQNIQGDGFKYQGIVTYSDQVLKVTHSYERTKRYIEGDEFPLFLSKHNEIQNELPFYISYDPDALSAGDSVSWLSIFLTIIFLGIGTFLALTVYKKYDPEPELGAKELSFGGWLILPAIGLAISPFKLVYDIVNAGFFNPMIWTAYVDDKFEYTLYIGFELAYNILYLVFVILLCILFIKKRTSFPKLIIVMYIANLLIPVVDALGYYVVFSADQVFDLEDRKLIMRSLIGACIWIPYFITSKRVKNTFTRKFQKEPLFDDVLVSDELTLT